jgi:hypothetical protein
LIRLGFKNLPSPKTEDKDGRSDRTLGDVGFYLVMLPNNDPFVVPADQQQLGGDSLDSGWYVQPWLFFSGSDAYQFGVDYGVNAGLYQYSTSPLLRC